MIHGFTVGLGRVLQAREFCTVSNRGANVTYDGSVDLHMHRGDAIRSMWTYHQGVFQSTPKVSASGPPNRAQIIRTVNCDRTSSLFIQTRPALRRGEEVRIDAHAQLEHAIPLQIFRRTSGRYGLALLQLEVFFTGDSQPKRVWQCEWTQDGQQHRSFPATSERSVNPTCIESGNSTNMRSVVRLSLKAIPPERTYGFRWEW